MDYQEAIEWINERKLSRCENCIRKGSEYCGGNCRIENEVFKTAISAMNELQEYHKTGLSPKQVADTICELSATKRVLGHYQQLGTLEEVREAVEKQCEHCGYKIHSDNVSKLNSCNDCGMKTVCKKRPDYGDYCRINCYDWSEVEE